MRLLKIIPLVVLISSGCSKKELVEPKLMPSPQRLSEDVKKVLMDGRREQIQLLAVKHRLSPAKAELAAWDYYEKHDVGFRVLNESTTGKKLTNQDILKIKEKLDEGVADTVKALALKYGFNEESFAAFLADLRASQRTQN